MSDARLRDLGRRAARGGPEDQAAHLRERVKAGEVTREGVRLAAHLGDPVARLAMGWTHGIGDMHPLDSWLTGLGRYPGALERAAVAVGRAVLGAHNATCLEHGGDRCPESCWQWSRALEAVEAWIADPTEGATRRVDEATLALVRAGSPWIAFAALVRALCGLGRQPRPVPALGGKFWRQSGLTEPQVRDVVRSALVPWALGVL